METKFTPGPWRVSQTYPVGDYCIHAAGCPWQLAYIAANTNVDWPLEANAHLIAAAPDLYAALERTLSYLTSYPGNSGINAWEQARAALSKARGETHGERG